MWGPASVSLRDHNDITRHYSSGSSLLVFVGMRVLRSDAWNSRRVVDRADWIRSRLAAIHTPTMFTGRHISVYTHSTSCYNETLFTVALCGYSLLRNVVTSKGCNCLHGDIFQCTPT